MSEVDAGLTLTQVGSAIGGMIATGLLTYFGVRRGKKKAPEEAAEADDAAGQLRLLQLQMKLQDDARDEQAKFYARLDQFATSIGESIRNLQEELRETNRQVNERIAKVEHDVLWLQATSEE